MDRMKQIQFYKLAITLFSALFLFHACQSDKKIESKQASFIYPDEGEIFKSGDVISLKMDIAGLKFDSIVYKLDSGFLAKAIDTLPINFDTKNLTLGNRVITALIYNAGKSQEVATNIVLLSGITPQSYTYKIVNSFAHDTSSYTEGLEFNQGFFYESDGEYGGSSLRKTSINGKVLQVIDIDKKYFAEGITVLGDKIIQLTYKEGIGFEYDKATFKLLRTFPYNHTIEGWGLTHNETTIYNTDGSNKIFKLNHKTYQSEGYFEVYDDKGPVTSLNELEWIDGKLYANIYGSDLLAIINPQNGEVEAYINLMNLPKGKVADEANDVLNGIAYDSTSKKLFVTGKYWDKLFEIKLIKN